MVKTNACRRQVLSEGATGTVELCVCGMVHVNVGPLTVRLDQQAFHSLAETLSEAAGGLRRWVASGDRPSALS